MFKELFQNQKEFLNYFFDHVNTNELDKVFDLCRQTNGVLVFTGVGKSGIIAKKISQTLISTGTKAIFLPVLDALHGDIGVIAENDILFCFSKSGNTQEIIDIIPYAKKKKAQIISVSSTKYSKIEKLSDFSVYLPLKRELCPFNLAPTTSTTLQIIFGDALAIALMQANKFSLQDYAINHPKGSIGSKISNNVSNIMLKYDQLPIALKQNTLLSKLEELTSKKCGCLLIVDSTNNLIGIFTDGDLRRALEKYGENVLSYKLEELMTANFKSTSPNALIWQAVNQMEEDPEKLITVLPVVENNKLIGLIRMHDILQSRMR